MRCHYAADEGLVLFVKVGACSRRRGRRSVRGQMTVRNAEGAKVFNLEGGRGGGGGCGCRGCD